MARVLPSLVALVLLGATASAFALTEGLKLEKSPITRTQVGKLFSPVCVCAKDHVRIRFFLRKADRVTVTIRSSGGSTIDTVVSDKAFRRGWVDLRWDGIEPSGIVAGNGTYEPAVHLAHEHRTIVLPNPIRVDTSPPKVIGASVKPLVLSPDGDGHGDVLTVHYKLSEPAHGILYVDGAPAVYSKYARTDDRIHFYGRLHGEVLDKGAHSLTFRAEDQAGNLSKPGRLGTLTIRYVTLARKLVSVGPGDRFYIRVSADTKLVHWLFAGRRGQAKPGTLVFRAPRKQGSYRLYVTAAGHAASARVKVETIR